MAEVEMPHPGHENHLCYLQNVGFLKNYPDDYRELLKNTQFYCKECGRAAASEDKLCEPEKL
jgi:hypothetical protein